MEVFKFLSEYLNLGIGGAILAALLFVYFLYQGKKSKKVSNEIDIDIKAIDIKDITPENAKTIEAVAQKYSITDLPEQDRLKYILKHLKQESKIIQNKQTRFYFLSALTLILLIMLFVFGLIYFMRRDMGFDETTKNEDKLINRTNTELTIPEMVKISGGTYKIGISKRIVDSLLSQNYCSSKSFFSNEMPQKSIITPDFYISKYEITVKQFNDYLKATNKGIKTLPDEFNSDNQPIIEVTWNDANNYCQWLSQTTGKIVRLPYEIEWEIAAKGNSQNLYAWGNSCPDNNNCNFKSSGIKSTVSIGGTPSNKSVCDVYNMSGNVAEWCQDWYHPNHYNRLIHEIIKELPQSKEKVIRGGGWTDIVFYLRCTARFFAEPEASSNAIGFRIVSNKNLTIKKEDQK